MNSAARFSIPLRILSGSVASRGLIWAVKSIEFYLVPGDIPGFSPGFGLGIASIDPVAAT